MRGVDNAARRRPAHLIVTLLLALAFLAVVGLPARALAELYTHLDALSANVRSGDLRAAGDELGQVTRFYETSRALGLQWLADPLFRDAFLQRAAYAYVAEDYEAVVTDLEGKVDDPLAAYLLGCARFRIAQRRYREITGRDAKATAQKVAIIQEVLELINPDFERAVRADPNDRFAYKWNYDLTSDPEAIRRALEEPRFSDPSELDQKRGARSPVRGRRG